MTHIADHHENATNCKDIASNQDNVKDGSNYGHWSQVHNLVLDKYLNTKDSRRDDKCARLVHTKEDSEG